MNLQNIKDDINFICGSTSANYPDADKIRNINIEYQNVARLIWSTAGGWQFDDSNATTLPIAQSTLVHNQQDYTLPSTAQRVEEVVIKDKGGTWLKLKPFDIHETDLAPETFMGSAGLPMYYDLVGRSVMLYPKPSSAYCTMASGIGVYVSRDVTEFPASAGTAYTPGFATPFHRILSLGASIDFLQDNTQRQTILLLKDRLEKGLINFYSKRDVESTPNISPRSKKTWMQYI